MSYFEYDEPIDEAVTEFNEKLRDYNQDSLDEFNLEGE